eukprot:1141533-Pelagomonas_calceolata.AAC.2
MQALKHRNVMVLRVHSFCKTDTCIAHGPLFFAVLLAIQTSAPNWHRRRSWTCCTACTRASTPLLRT